MSQLISLACEIDGAPWASIVSRLAYDVRYGNPSPLLRINYAQSVIFHKWICVVYASYRTFTDYDSREIEKAKSTSQGLEGAVNARERPACRHSANRLPSGLNYLQTFCWQILGL